MAVVSAIAGAASALAFGWIGGIAASIAAGVAAWVLFASRKKFPASSAPETAAPGAPAAVPESVPTEISADRIDPLTGLANENGLAAWFAERGARLAADGKGLIVLVARLDDFDQVVARRGRTIADEVLKEVAARVAAVAGSEGIAARTGGDEFASVVAVVPARADALASERAGHLIELIGRPVEHPAGSIWLGGSVGAAYGSPLKGPETLARARTALAQAMRQGRGQFVVAKAE
ncbi:MAG TPA: hypothetical protein DIC34_08320 [Treponema sp.]|nr:hypothetical protein [Treponema sp.]